MFKHLYTHTVANWHSLIKTTTSIWNGRTLEEDHRICLYYLDNKCVDISCACGKIFWQDKDYSYQVNKMKEEN